MLIVDTACCLINAYINLQFLSFLLTRLLAAFSKHFPSFQQDVCLSLMFAFLFSVVHAIALSGTFELKPIQPKIFHVDSPFAFAIKKNGAVLFAGRIRTLVWAAKALLICSLIVSAVLPLFCNPLVWSFNKLHRII